MIDTCEPVYRRLIPRATLLSSVVMIVAVVAGCSSSPKWNADDFFIAARYELPNAKKPCTAWERGVDVQYDFGRLANLGFDTILVKSTCDADTKTALDAAATQRMAVALSLQVYEKSDTDTRTSTSSNGYHYAPVPSSLVRHKSLRAAVVESGCDRSGACRAVDVCSSVSKAGLRCIPLFEAGHLAESGKETPCREAREIAASAPAVVDTSRLADKQSRSPKQQLLAQFHAALSAQQTGGLVVTGWRHEDSASSSRFDSLPAPRAAVTALIQRAKRWGPRLIGSTVVKANAAIACGPCFRVTIFVRGDRRHILVFNPAPDRRARGDLRISTRFAGKRIEKAVQVPDETSTSLGKVYHAAHGAIVVPLSLPPGEAVLFEVF